MLVVAQIRPDEAVDGRERAGGLARGEDDEVLVVIIVVELQLVVIVVVLVRRLGIAGSPCRTVARTPAAAPGASLSSSSAIVRSARDS